MSASTQSPSRVKTSVLKLESKPATVAQAAAPATPWYRTTWFLGLASSIALWLPLSPLNLAPLAWVAPLGWLLLIRAEKMAGKRAYGMLYLTGIVHWLLVMEGVRRAYWALYFGWLALAAYLAVYLVLFVGLSRFAVHRLRVPLCVAAPSIWVGLELLRGYVLTGFSMGLLGHTQAEVPALIQIADVGGAYAVSFVVMFVAAAIAQTFPWWFGKWQRWPIAATALLLVAVLGYGQYRLQQAKTLTKTAQSLHVVLLQNSVDTIFGVPSDRHVATYKKYLIQAADAAGEHPQTQLMVWPESVFSSDTFDVVFDDDAQPPAMTSWTAADFEIFRRESQRSFSKHTRESLERINGRTTSGQPAHQIPQLVGTTTFHFRKDRVDTYNSAVLLSPAGNVIQRYSKQHLVMFGEYIPLGEMFPRIYQLSPMPAGLSRGKVAEVFEVAGHKLAPSICFESTVPHLIRRQIRELDARGESPDMLVNVTNDGWFWGSGVLDLHYKCAIFRAVENRRPMLVAANTGFSTAVDAAGQVLAVGPRRDVATLVAAVPAYRLASFYTWAGDLFAGFCLAFTLACATLGLWQTRKVAPIAT